MVPGRTEAGEKQSQKKDKISAFFYWFLQRFLGARISFSRHETHTQQAYPNKAQVAADLLKREDVLGDFDAVCGVG